MAFPAPMLTTTAPVAGTPSCVCKAGEVDLPDGKGGLFVAHERESLVC